jgi:hypothetical protein
LDEESTKFARTELFSILTRTRPFVDDKKLHAKSNVFGIAVSGHR